MAELIETQCRDCQKQYTLKLGTGMVYWPLEDVIRYTRGNVRRRLRDLVDHHEVISSEYGHRLFACPRCDTLHQRFYVRVDYNPGQRYSSEVYETTFRCGTCRGDLAERSKPISGYRCNGCGSYALEDGTLVDRD